MKSCQDDDDCAPYEYCYFSVFEVSPGNLAVTKSVNIFNELFMKIFNQHLFLVTSQTAINASKAVDRIKAVKRMNIAITNSKSASKDAVLMAAHQVNIAKRLHGNASRSASSTKTAKTINTAIASQQNVKQVAAATTTVKLEKFVT